MVNYKNILIEGMIMFRCLFNKKDEVIDIKALEK